jgi:hypothetical protein
VGEVHYKEDFFSVPDHKKNIEIGDHLNVPNVVNEKEKY